MSESLLVDPYLFQRPATGEWVAAARSIFSLLSQKRFPLLVSRSCVAILFESNLVPYFNLKALSESLKSEGELRLPADTIQKLAATFFQGGAAHIEELCSCLNDEVMLDPPEVTLRHAQNMRSPFLDTLLAYLILDNNTKVGSRPDASLATETDLEVSAHVHDYSPATSCTYPLPHTIVLKSRLIFEIPDEVFDEVAFVNDPDAALKLAYEELVAASDKPDYRLREFFCHSSFKNSLASYSSEGWLLRIIAKQAVRVISGQEARFPSMDIHRERVGPGAGEQDVVRDDGAVRFRATVTKRGAGYRLRYWKVNDTYELISVDKESDI